MYVQHKLLTKKFSCDIKEKERSTWNLYGVDVENADVLRLHL
jgi:hypothetical protein